MPQLPSLFISHGSPMILMDDCPARQFMTKFLSDYGATIEKPDAILMISAHWETNSVAVASTKSPPTIHDFFGFPDKFYEYNYHVQGSSVAAEKSIQCLRQAGYSVFEERERGLDHGAWVPLKYMFPEGDIPIAQLSIQCHLGPEHHLQLGQALAPLRGENVLIIASGNITHGRRAGEVNEPEFDWVAEFSDWVHRSIENHCVHDLINFREFAPHAKKNHPTDDHYVPLLVAIGAAGIEYRNKLLHSSYTYRTISMNSYAFF